MATDPDAFHDFEQQGWERAAEFYGDAFGALTAQTAGPMLDAVGAAPGTRLLDVACGPGFIAAPRPRAARSSPASTSRRRWSLKPAGAARRSMFREGDAEALPFDAASFDAVVMNFGLLHLARPDAALAEAHRVLRPGGRYAFTVWAAPERAVGVRDGVARDREARQQGRAAAGGAAVLPVQRRRGNRAATLESIGFTSVDVRELPLCGACRQPTWCSTRCRAAACGPPPSCARRHRRRSPRSRDAVRRGVEAYAARRRLRATDAGGARVCDAMRFQISQISDRRSLKL